MNTASKSTVAQQWAGGVEKLTPYLRRARQLFYGVVSRDPRDVQLRRWVDGTCQVIAFVDATPAGEKRLRDRGLVRGADGVVVLAEAPNWEIILGLRPTEG